MSDAKGSFPESTPPPYPGSQAQPSGYGMQPTGQTNYGFQGGYGQPQPQQYGYSTSQQTTNTNVVVTQVGGQTGYTVAPVDYSTQALIACLCCFWPTGLLAMMKASESRDAVARGDLPAAHAAANSARQMIRISWIVGIISVVALGVILGVYYGVVFNSIYTYDDDY